MENWKSCIAILLVGLTLVSARAMAAPIVYEFTLTPDSIGPNNPFGIASLPAGPFAGFFSIDDADLAVDLPLAVRLEDVLTFGVTVGNTAWSLGDLADFQFAVSSGDVSGFQFDARTGNDFLGVRGAVGWIGFDDATACELTAPNTSPGCIMGLDLDTVAFARQVLAVSEPGALPLFAAATVGLGLLLRRRRTGIA
jgi:hypothetical protein